MKDSEVFSVDELASYLSMNAMTIYRLASAGKIPGFKVGRVWRFRKKVIDGWIRQQEESGKNWNDNELNEVRTCSVCSREIGPQLKTGGECEEKGCNEPICATCWSARRRRRCPTHFKAVSSESTIGRLAAGEKGVVPSEGPATAQELLTEHVRHAKALEINFISRFDFNIRSFSVLSGPKGQLLAKISSWEKLHSREDEIATLRKNPQVTLSTKEIIQTLPINASSAYRVPLGKKNPFGEARHLVIMAKFWAELDSLLDSNPAQQSKKELLSFLSTHAKRAEESRDFVVLGVCSPSGWSNAAKKLVSGEVNEKYSSSHLVACLLGPGLSDHVFDAHDPRVRPFLRLFQPETHFERVTSIKDRIAQGLVGASHVVLGKIAKQVGGDNALVEEAAQELSADEEFLAIANVRGVGKVIKWNEGGAK
jgi:excisionase family DNA binding protein